MEIFKLLVFVYFIQGLDAYRTKGTITSPGYPDYYPKNCNITWMIEAPLNANNISISIEDQDIHKTKGYKCDDFLKIEEYEPKFTLYKQCGKGSIRRITAYGRIVLISFISDDFGTARGFKLQWSVASYMDEDFTSRKMITETSLKVLTTAAQSLPTYITRLTQASTYSMSSSPVQSKRSQTVPQTTTFLRFLTTAREKALVKESALKKFSNIKTRKMVILKNSTPTSTNPSLLTNGPNYSEFNTFQTIKDNNVISTEPPECSSTSTVETEPHSQSNYNQSSIHNLAEENTNSRMIPTTKSTLNPSSWEENILPLSTKSLKASDKTETTRTKEKSNLATSSSRETDQTHQNPTDQTQSEVIFTSMDMTTTLQSSTTEKEVKKEMPSSHLNSFIPVLLSVCGFLFFLLFIFLFIVFVQRLKIKRLQEEPQLSYLHNNRRYSTILQMEHRPIEGIHIYDHAGRVLPSRKENDYKYLSPESCPKHNKSQKIKILQDRASKRYFCPAELSEIQEKTNYIEILPDASAVYYEPASSFESTAIYAQSAKRRPYSTLNEVQQRLDVSEYEFLDLSKMSSES
ncbi:uncharacterized protein LOC134260147 [Saccostrea cucullata]|uniref:uncharacterized protein LOC134260147 n=1 Tax=Saccostrea cuccullata TaxID=36930 RepID=UPI002ED60681